jgi:hypothetical protein
MKQRKNGQGRRKDPAKKARRQARIVVGPVPPSRVIPPARQRKAKHKKKAGEEDAQ